MFYTNICECLNSMLHEKVRYKASEWHKFNDAMKDLVKQSYQIAELSIIDHGDFCFRQQYQHLIVDQQRWFKMTQKQRQSHINKVAATVPTHSISEQIQNNSSLLEPTSSSSSDGISLSKDSQATLPIFEVSAVDSHIQSLPAAVLAQVWDKARELLSKPGLVMDAPSISTSNGRSYVVASKSSQRPHIIQQAKSGQFFCEASCPMWQSSRICSHCVAAAQFSNQLKSFISWYNKSKSLPNFDKLSKVGMPRGSGRKGEKPPRKRKKTSSAAPLALIAPPDTEPTPDESPQPDMQPHDKQ